MSHGAPFAPAGLIYPRPRRLLTDDGVNQASANQAVRIWWQCQNRRKIRGPAAQRAPCRRAWASHGRGESLVLERATSQRTSRPMATGLAWLWAFSLFTGRSGRRRNARIAGRVADFHQQRLLAVQLMSEDGGVPAWNCVEEGGRQKNGKG